jgi:hypothetical protein
MYVIILDLAAGLIHIDSKAPLTIFHSHIQTHNPASHTANQIPITTIPSLKLVERL